MTHAHLNRLGKQPYDPRDRVLASGHAALPLGAFKVDRLTRNIPIRDQGQVSDCLCYAVDRLHQYLELAGGEPLRIKSCLFNYHWIRVAEGTTDQDCGGTLRGAFKALKRYGACQEIYFPDEPRNLYIAPTHAAITDGLKHRAITYTSIANTVRAMRAAIAAGHPVAFGMGCPDDLEQPDFDGELRTIRYPTDAGHALVADGGEDDLSWPGGGWFWIDNSWGSKWGHPKEPGCFKMSFSAAATVWDTWQMTKAS